MATLRALGAFGIVDKGTSEKTGIPTRKRESRQTRGWLDCSPHSPGLATHVSAAILKPMEKKEEKENKIPAKPEAGEKKPPKEIGGPKGPEPTRYGDWERGGRCTDF
jgi:hypothetical protein